MILVKTARNVKRTYKMYKFFKSARSQGYQMPMPVGIWKLYKAVKTE